MNNLNFWILITIYTLFGISIIYFEIKEYLKNKKIRFFDFFTLFYFFIYCITPICSLIMLKNGSYLTLKAFKYLETDSLLFKYIVAIVPIIFYYGMTYFYNKFIKKSNLKLKKSKFLIDEDSKSFYVGTFILLVIGFLALIIYTRAYGSLFGIFKYAPLIRDNIFLVENKFTFMAPFIKLLIFSSLNYVILLKKMKNKTLSYKVVTTICSLISFFGLFVVLIALDSRMLILSIILIIGYYLIFDKISNINKKLLIKLGLFAAIFIFIIINMNNITYIIREKNFDKLEKNNNIVEFISKEFSFTYVNNLNLLERKINQRNVDIRIDDNIFATLVSLLPTRYKKVISMDMHRYNTSFTKNPIGQIPVDLISASVYSLGFVGIIVFMGWIGLLVSKIEFCFQKYQKLNEFYKMMFSYFALFISLRFVAYYDISTIIFQNFALIISYIGLRIINIHKFDSITSKIYECLVNPKKIIISLMNKNVFFFLPDKIYLKIKFRLILGEKLNLNNPKTFNEKLQWLKLYDRKTLYTKMVDKYEVKDYVANIIGDEYIIPTYGVYDKFSDIDFSNLPEKFVIKTNHDSGGIIICSDKNKFDTSYANEKISKSLKNKYYYLHREYPYKNVKPKILIEKYLGNDLIDYRFYCFNGKIKLIYQYVNESCLDGTKPEPQSCNIYDPEWNLLPFRQSYPPSKNKYEKPIQLNKMIKLATKLSKKTNFVRVDFYVIDKQIYFSELTFFPGAGFSKFYPKEKDLEIGSWIKLPNKEKCDKNEK